MDMHAQQELLKKVLVKWPEWSAEMASGYVHGVWDEARREAPPRSYRKEAALVNKPYARGYVWGFVDARGPDIFDLCTELFSPSIDFRWWENAKTD